MNKEALKRAQGALQLQDIFQVSASARLSEEYEPKFDDQHELAVQTRHAVVRSQVLEPTDPQSHPKLFRVFLEVAVRWAYSPDEQAPDGGDAKSMSPLGGISTTYCAEYVFKRDLDEEALDCFALRNASFHVWPFFREFIASQCARMNVPKLMLPMLQHADNRDSERASQNDETAAKQEHRG